MQIIKSYFGTPQSGASASTSKTLTAKMRTSARFMRFYGEKTAAESGVRACSFENLTLKREKIFREICAFFEK